ncbi:hypothetical protein BJ508DRAFT_340238 [Ascobolus immersus RN42]|uniref:Uncharacterized protein n=1 Tax=Ascobolus immersus RN42 TaxID=1160509 RepID=A0A3N4HRF4_ASCIM|nr:hypothetical protein BJ508DRAFT_340238 [Ascobolus immersus RN42]
MSTHTSSPKFDRRATLLLPNDFTSTYFLTRETPYVNPVTTFEQFVHANAFDDQGTRTTTGHATFGAQQPLFQHPAAPNTGDNLGYLTQTATFDSDSWIDPGTANDASTSWSNINNFGNGSHMTQPSADFGSGQNQQLPSGYEFGPLADENVLLGFAQAGFSFGYFGNTPDGLHHDVINNGPPAPQPVESPSLQMPIHYPVPPVEAAPSTPASITPRPVQQNQQPKRRSRGPRKIGRFPCPHHDCKRNQPAPGRAFTRQDNLRAHLRQVHEEYHAKQKGGRRPKA